ncbi:hypothetical protein CAPTEDRAFT_189114 [Capitella teleta]|uniref:Sulfotransferase domain-containing protein n=1 Tax=Capitella teleta TaxID=283909 RepID=R7T3M7_CAPTE|nr:hypothetical protein CAPTEDRAFT_189114 [Capitella teleta]|eukprot:ELT87318.1 hypothetical protein CAPTEDRAFT_189114 [Capitella teleta]
MPDLAILLQFCFSSFWRLFNHIWYSILHIKWRLDGLANKIEANQQTTRYHQSAQVLTIIGRYCFDKIVSRNSMSDFLAVHEKFVDPSYVLTDECSLYDISEQQVLFVESSPGVDVSRMKYGAFHRQAQFKQAIRLITMPMYAFHRLAQKVGPPRSRVIFLEYLPRTGSTLACKMFESTEKCVSISEPNIFLEYVSYHTNDEKLTADLISGVKLFCKPKNQDVQPLAFVFKIVPMKPKVFKSLTEEFNSSQLFIYRNPMKSVMSLAKSCQLSPTFRLMTVLMQIMPGIKSKFIPKLSGRGMVTTSVKNLILKSKHFVVLSSFLMWGGLVQAYRNQLNEEYSLEIPAIKYEHFISNPKASTEAMFKHVGLPADLVPLAIHGMLEDSQKDTIVSRRNMSQCASIGDPKGELAQELLVLCDMFGLDSYTDLDLPNTITSL